MKTQDVFIDDIFDKVSKKDKMFSFKDKHVIISFKYETDMALAYHALNESYYVIVDEDNNSLIVVCTDGNIQ